MGLPFIFLKVFLVRNNIKKPRDLHAEVIRKALYFPSDYQN